MSIPKERSIRTWSELAVTPRLPLLPPTRRGQPGSGSMQLALVQQGSSSLTAPASAGPQQRANAVAIDYAALSKLNSIDGLRGDVYDTSIEAHDKFIARVSMLLKQPRSPWQERLSRAKHHTAAIERHRRVAHEEAIAAGYGHAAAEPEVRRSIHAIITCRPFERTSDEVSRLVTWIHDRYPSMRSLPRSALQTVAETAWHESYDEAGLAFAGDFESELTGLVLRGTVKVAPVGHADKAWRNTPKQEVSSGGAFGAGHLACTGAVTAGSAAVLIFSRVILNAKLDKIAERGNNIKFNVLKHVPALTRWTASALRDVCPLFTWHALKAGETFLTEGKPASYFGIVASGQCGVYRDVMPSGTATGRRKTVRVLVGTVGKGASFGEVSVLGVLPKASRRLSQRQASTDPRSSGVGGSEDRLKPPTTSTPRMLTEPCTVKALDAVKFLVVDAATARQLDPLLVMQLCGKTSHGFDRLSPEELAQLQAAQESQVKWAQLKQDIWHDVAARRS
eukprot:m.47013 g.47013  ORF g.47013 m.47013 type:complete len:507 (+) comp6832_c0_seq1:329-1849(+)